MSGCSTVVPTYNRIEYLKKCLDSLLDQNFNNFEIIVVNDNSTDSTADYLRSIRNKNIKIVNHSRNLGSSESRNSGIDKARFSIIAFIDDDCIASPNWLRSLMGSFKDDGVDFVIGQVYYVKEGYQGYFPERLVRNHDARWPMGCNLAFKKEVFQKIRGFNKVFDKYHNEDSEIAIRAIANNLIFYRSLEAVVYHQKTNWTVKSLLSSARNSSVWPLLKKKYPLHYTFFKPPIKNKIFINIEDYFYILFLPILIPALLARYVLHGKKDFKIFFTKWPIYLFLRRYYIYKEAIKNRILML